MHYGTGNVESLIHNYTGTAETRYSDTRNIETAIAGNYETFDWDRYIATYRYNSARTSASLFTDADNNWTAVEYHNTNKDDGILDAHWGSRNDL